MRDKVLQRWVKQPPASPEIQYLRDAERLNAWEQLGERTRVLDIASESNVTAGLQAEEVARVDFSADAIDHARDILGEKVGQYEVADPEKPDLPFPDNHFDAAVSIGPYDWKFLDIDHLTAEVNRVLEPDGLFSFSVPTPRSPYATRGRNRFRYYEPEEALDIIAPDWQLVDYDLVFQYPDRIHRIVKSLPNTMQEPFVDFSWRVTEELTERDRWNEAAYLVLGAKPMEYDDSLDTALECLFRPAEENGFWDEHESKFIRGLDYSIDTGEHAVSDPSDLSWTRDDTIQWRYAPFALMGSMQWRVSELGTDQFDEQLRDELAYFEDKLADDPGRIGMPSYGIGPLILSYALADSVFEEDYTEMARTLFEYSREAFDFSHAEDSLLAYGWSYLYEQTGDEDVLAAIEDALWKINERLDPPSGTFQFENGTTRRHQNQMYTIWGMARAIEVTGKTGYLDSLELVLDHTIDERMQADGAFIWEDVSQPIRGWTEFVIDFFDRRPPHWDFLYECHQTFFVNAVSHYYAAGGETDYDREVGQAMAWIFGDNVHGEDLVELSGLGVPLRFMTRDGRMDVPDQMYKGAYEVGSYVMALTNLLDGDGQFK
ncbi:MULTISPECIES: class I SAM-dependent methyltransferase [unclassified Haladaptatus]|uniref:class I SAM-dependent methyltransferase n=1 Tax=unclassified Haladaptatus TaxID=2622732 RepID=UPI0023E75D8A|nr:MULTISPECIES: class I SAM-dependent methyltransferase [unclassified Haladaptatus]